MTGVVTGAGAAGATKGPAVPVREFRLPDLGEGLTESEIVRWHIAEGDTVVLNQIIADVETAKAVVELPSPYAGKVVRLHVAAGTVVDVGSPIVSFDVAGDVDGAVPGPHPVAGVGPVPPSGARGGEVPARREPNLVGYGAAVEQGGRPQRRSRTIASIASAQLPERVQCQAHAPSSSAPGQQERGRRNGERPRSTPPVRKLARDLGISLDVLTGSGPGSLIKRADVLAAYQGTAGGPEAPTLAGSATIPSAMSSDPAVAGLPTAPPPPQAGRSSPGVTRTPIKGMRKHTAAAMVASAFTAPHVTEFLTIDVTPTMDLLAELRSSRAFEGTRITLLAIVSKAVCIAVARNPTLNSSWDEESQEIVQYPYVNLGIAAATPRGLLVPNIASAHAMTLTDLAVALRSLTETARAGRTPPADLAGGTISITNIGTFGIDAGTPILNPGEAAILAMGAVRRTPWEYQGAVALRSVLTLSLSFDHRLVDGEQGSRFLADVGTILRNPAMVLAMV
ncbi:dihydrolipoamide acetyltransferase family protein [Arthrobacter sp. B1805]|uniref:dihydrolipoamide acetyltransferase family protein n=1 Tax=Arthrobacter sp. B1805 TaxID=2058892 RepID=UPI000CE40107|nr:dihydrolipoamide acetyltransferase family protein [Arthrobacter sp. B1805]